VGLWASLPLTVQAETWPATGSYQFDGWEGPALTVFYSVPPQSTADSPILIVIPGARRDAREYRDDWDSLATANRLITLVVGADLADFPTEYDYNAGGVVTAQGVPRPRSRRLYSAIEPLFEDFTRRFGSRRSSYALYGHSAGGQFAHTFRLFEPTARVDRVVAANPAFCMLPDHGPAYPFGLGGVTVSDEALKHWLTHPLVVLLGDRDLDPRTKPLSNGPEARLQGPHVFARGLGFYRSALAAASVREITLGWKLEVVHNVGHSNRQMASHAVKYLVPH
jgi:hypothetical protein